MNIFLKAAVVAAGLIAGTSASAAVVVYTPTAVTPTGATLVTNVDLNVGQFITATEVLAPGDSAEFTFTALERLRVSTIALAGVDNNSGIDLGNVEFGFTSATTDSFSTIVSFGATGSAIDSLAGLTLEAGESFTIFWEDGLSAPVGLAASFRTTAIPVPAALPLMIGGIAALGAVSRKKKNA
ncbi:VPLPA-CTERM sorting domain-containing protein [Meridianimarinicoccus sp. RP-17]|uniref:VPLPA-CTERM sorting domain-containing protein n=1 Tax=Meridianimarinicoccus zhengii TaxID=2056810 RepID=UPI000DAE265D|nr:VPLPA-CTERM sorting domain-containing protein [Phycocomes zhengii]